MKQIRNASEPDREEIFQVHMSAFQEDEARRIADLALDLLDESGETISLLAEIDGKIAGHIAFSPVAFEGLDDWSGYILAPLGVRPEFQSSGVGSDLINTGIGDLSKRGADFIFVYGDPKYYGKFGFETDAASSYKPGYELTYPFGWQAINLSGKTSSGTVNISCLSPLNDPQLW